MNSKTNSPTHAGGVVYRQIGEVREYLLITSRRFSFIWVLPKGHIEDGESEEDTATREVKEESGMLAEIVMKIGLAEKRKWNFEKQVVAFYLMKYLSFHKTNKENRKVIWLPLEKAISKLFYQDQKRILKSLKDKL